MADKIQYEKQSSIEVTRNAKGDYAFKVKTYYNEEERSGMEVVDYNKMLMNKLWEEFVK
jgi:hypothetical protein